MRENSLRALWADGGVGLGGWLTVPSGFSAEIMASAGFDWVCIDMQHGMIAEPQMIEMLQGISSTDVTPLVRVPRNEAGVIGKCLDAGAWGVIVPMVNSAEEAMAAADACRYAPEGIRSYGPLRANYYAGFDYFSRANEQVLCIGMVETRSAVERVDEIASVPGVDGIYIGPADLSITLGLPPAPDQSDPNFTNALERVVESCRQHGVVPGIAGNADTAPKRIEQGFRFVEVASDVGLLGVGAGRALAQVKPTAVPSKSAYL
ncbi:MAG: aldolase/citrate lyase family protein [Acidimicrobiales bacterium]